MLAIRPFFSVCIPCKLQQWHDQFQIATYHYSLSSEFIWVSVTFVQSMVSLLILLSQVKPKWSPVRLWNTAAVFCPTPLQQNRNKIEWHHEQSFTKKKKKKKIPFYRKSSISKKMCLWYKYTLCIYQTAILMWDLLLQIFFWPGLATENCPCTERALG